jgi:hypothetical protein
MTSMIINSSVPPEFRDPFLKAVAVAFRRRGKAIKYQGNLEFSYDPTGTFEWLTVIYWSFNQPSLNLQLSEGGWINFSVRSQRNANRGKVLIRLEDLRIVSNAALIVSTFEWTISKTYYDDQVDLSGWKEIEERWRKLSIRIAK